MAVPRGCPAGVSANRAEVSAESQVGAWTVSTRVAEKGTWGHLLTEAMAVRHQLQLGMGRQFLQPADFQALPSSRDDIAWQKKAGKMLLPHDFSLVDAFCRFLSKRRTQESRQLKIAALQAMSSKEFGVQEGAVRSELSVVFGLSK